MTARGWSEGLGQGTSGASDGDEYATPVEGITLLVVDSEIASARALIRLLRDDGFTVELATDGSLAIARLSRDPLPRVLISDLHLPGADGTAVANYARSRNPKMHVVFVTARPELARKHALDPSAVVFKKPVEYQALHTHLLLVTGQPPSSRKPR